MAPTAQWILFAFAISVPVLVVLAAIVLVDDTDGPTIEWDDAEEEFLPPDYWHLP